MGKDQTVPYGTDLFFVATRHFVPGYLHMVPSGQRLRHLSAISAPPQIKEQPSRTRTITAITKGFAFTAPKELLNKDSG